MIVRLAARARAEFASALAFLHDNSEQAAEALRFRLEAAIDSLTDFPDRGRPGRIEGSRELLVRKTSYVVVYRIEDDVVRVLRIRHTSQDPSPD